MNTFLNSANSAKPQPVNEFLNIETQTLATNSAESAGKDYVSCLNVIPESNIDALPWTDSEAKNKLLNNNHSAALRFKN